jgi:multidrug resistance protein MdtO
MATANPSLPHNLSAYDLWINRIWQDLQPTPGRVSASLRITLASVLTLLVLMILQMPFASLGLYFVFLVGRDSPALSIRSGLFSLITLMAAAALELAVVILSDNNPMARLLGVAAVSFLAGILMLGSSLPALASTWGFIFCTLIATWDNQLPSNALVEGSLWLVATASVALFFSIAVEYVFGTQHPADKLQEQRLIRYQALEAMFNLYAQGSGPRELSQAVIRVTRLAVVGQAGMRELYNKIVERNLAVVGLPVGTRVRITMLAQLMDLAAAFATQNPDSCDPELRQRCALLAARCADLRLARTPDPGQLLELRPGSSLSILDRVEATLYTILSMPSSVPAMEDREMVALPAKKVPFLLPALVRNKDTVAFALKISLCATLCYILYRAVDWPGISTSVTTVLISGLSSSGAIKQKLVLRLLGSAIGGLIFGLGATAFLFPYMDSITSLVVLVAVIAFISAWCAGGRRFNYVGLQIAFSFYLVAFEGFSAPTQLAPARDRLIGILLALVVMAFVFDQIWPVRTVTAMRRALASVLHAEANLLQLIEKGRTDPELLRHVDALRDYMSKTIASLRTMAEAVDYEFGVNREEHLRAAETIIEAALSAASVFWNQLAFLHLKEDAEYLKEPGLIEMRRKLAVHMDLLADSAVRKTEIPPLTAAELVDPVLLRNPHYGEYTRNSVARYEELQKLVTRLSTQV